MNKTQKHDIEKAILKFTDLETEKNSLIEKLANAIFSNFQNANYINNKKSKSEIGKYEIDNIEILYSFQKNEVKFLSTSERKELISKKAIPKKPKNHFFDDYLLVGLLNLSKKKNSMLAQKCFSLAKKQKTLSKHPDLFYEFSESLLEKDVLKTVKTTLSSLDVDKSYDSVWREILNGIYPVRFISDIEQFSLFLFNEKCIRWFFQVYPDRKSFKTLFLDNNFFFSKDQIKKLKDFLNSKLSEILNKEDLVELFSNLGDFLKADLIDAEDYFTKFNEKVNDDPMKMFETLYGKDVYVLHEALSQEFDLKHSKFLPKLSDETLLNLFKSFMALRSLEEKYPTRNLHNNCWRAQIHTLLEIIDNRNLTIDYFDKININDYNSKEFLVSNLINNLKVVNLEANPSFVSDLILGLKTFHNPNRNYFIESIFNYKFLDTKYFFDHIEERKNSGTKFFINKEFILNLEKLILANNSGLQLSDDNKTIEDELKRILKLFKPKD